MKKHRQLALVALLAASCHEAVAEEQSKDVLLVCIDTLRADHLGAYGYRRNPTSPTLDALADESILFLDASATSGWTKPSVPSFMTGTLPAQHGVYEGSSKDGAGRISHVLPDDAVTIAEVFRERGYRTAAFVQNAQLRVGQGIEQGFETYVDRAGDAREIRWQAQDWLRESDQDRPFFLYLHFLDAHWPYPVPDDYAARFVAADAIRRFRTDDWKALRDAINDGDERFEDADRANLEALYDGAIRYVDDELGRLFRELERRDEWRSTIVSVISDHGEEFGEHGRIGHGHGLWENLLSVPWILRVPDRAAGRVEAAVSLIDLFPTLLAASGIVPPAYPGLDRLAFPGAEALVVAEHKAPSHYEHTLRGGDHKVARRFERDTSPADGAWPVGIGERWEAELQAQPDGSWLVTDLERDTDDVDDPPELKGRVTALDDASISIAGVRFERSSTTELRASDEASDLRVGVLAKVRYRGADDRTALRIKLYPPDASMDFEIRASVDRIDGHPASGRVQIGGFDALVGSETDIEGEPRRRRLDRDDIGDFVFGRLDRGDTLEIRWFDVARGERETPEPESSRGLLDALDEALQEYSLRRTYSAADRSRLGAQEIADLEAIGYVE